jgi:pimeloyl-ACP methyl ester carboxylesterase
MGASGFGTLASHFTDRTVVTYDPRGVERSTKADPTSQSTPDQHADDLHRIADDLGVGSVDLFASSGGAVNALAFVAKHPEQVRTLVAHEPPLASLLPDRENAMALTQAIADTYQREGFGRGMAQFITAVSYEGPITSEVASQPAPDPAMFGLPTQDDGTRTDPLLFQNITTCTHYQPDFDALRAASTRIVLASGEEGVGTMARRGRRPYCVLAPRRSSFRAATAASSATSTASRAIPTPAASCARSRRGLTSADIATTAPEEIDSSGASVRGGCSTRAPSGRGCIHGDARQGSTPRNGVLR